MVPYEFSQAGIEAASADAFRPYSAFLRSGEPHTSIFINNPWLMPPKAGEALDWGTGWYYDTTVARKHEYWRNIALPTPTKDLQQLRHDLHEWGLLPHRGRAVQRAVHAHPRPRGGPGGGRAGAGDRVPGGVAAARVVAGEQGRGLRRAAGTRPDQDAMR
ncbi:MAG: hypothetical protein ABMA25_00370 [Ilumatobacteraceae bacterium]